MLTNCRRLPSFTLPLLALLAVLPACTGSSPDPSAATSGEGLEQLTVAVPRDVGPLNIFASHEEPITELVYDKLLAPSPYVDEPRPWLAESVEALDPSTWEVRLRDDVTWHDGERFTAEDVVFTVEYFKAAPTGRWTHHVSDIPTIETIEATGDATVRFTCAFPCPDLGSITLADLPIVPEHRWAGIDEPAQETDLPVGTGPYRLVDYRPDSGYRFEANAEYFAGAPLVDELVMPVIVDPGATFTALRTGEIDAAARGLAPELLEQFRTDPAIEVATTASFSFLELRLNYEIPPFDVPAVRRALSRAIDREELLARVALGQGRPSTSGYPHPDSPWTNPDLSTPTDPEEAARILTEAGYVDRDGDGVREGPEGFPVSFVLKTTGSEPTHVRAAELVADHLGEVGVAVEVATFDAGAIDALFRTRDFDANIGEITAHGVADPTQFIMSHRSGYLWRAPAVPYPAWDTLFEDWKATTDLESRTEVLFEMQALFNRQPTSIPLLYPEEHWAFRPDAYDRWVESPGYGIIHKWSLLPPEVREAAGAVTPASG